MSKDEFLDNQRLVLKSAYAYAGYDADEHVSETEYLRYKVPLASRDGPRKGLKIDENTVAALILVDDANGVVEIDGAESLKTALFEVSSYIIERHREQKDEKLSALDMEIPIGAKCHLPLLPPGGIDNITYSELANVYWKRVIPVVLGEQRIKGYESQRYVVKLLVLGSVIDLNLSDSVLIL